MNILGIVQITILVIGGTGGALIIVGAIMNWRANGKRQGGEIKVQRLRLPRRRSQERQRSRNTARVVLRELPVGGTGADKGDCGNYRKDSEPCLAQYAPHSGTESYPHE